MNPNACTDTITFAQYMENNLHLFCLYDCYINLFPHFPKNDGKAFDDPVRMSIKNALNLFPHFPKSDGKAFEDPVRMSIKNALQLFGDKNLIQIKIYDGCFYFQLEMKD